MNLRRGLFRLWLVFAVLAAIGSFFAHADAIQRPSPSRYIILPSDDKFFKVRSGVYPELDEALRKVDFRHNIEAFVPKADTEEAFKRIVPRFNAEVVNKRPEQARIEAITNMIGWATIPSVALLALGSALAWAFSGFKRTA